MKTRPISCLTILLFLFSCLLTPAAPAAVPKLLTYQGVLKDSSGNFLTGAYSMTFRVYSASTGGTALWTETQSSVSATSGRFSVILGSVTTLNLSFDADYWLSIQVGTDAEMSPRVRLTSAGYTLMSENVVNSFTQAQHDALSHKNIEGVRVNAKNIAKTNFKLDAYTLASANNMGDLLVDTFTDATGISASLSTNYTYRGSPNYDVVVTPTGGGVIQQSTLDNDIFELLTGDNAAGQQFKHASQATVDRLAFKWCRYGSPTGNFRVRIYSDTNGFPGALLGESANLSVANIALCTSGPVEVTATLNSAVTIQANTLYFAVLESVDAAGGGANSLNVRRATPVDPYPDGKPVLKDSVGTWRVPWGLTTVDTFFKVYEQGIQGTATVVSNAYTESVAPKEAMVVAEETLGTGTTTYSVSRNNGTNWTPCTKDTICNIDSQPSGTQIRWKAVITGNAELDSIAVAL